MISLAPGTKVFLACHPIDLRCGFNGLAAKVQQVIGADPFGGNLFMFRGKRGVISRRSTGMALGCGCSPRNWSGAVSSGRRLSTAP